ncbi:CinA family nicotinamide mononucleotide deamidase-related protein [Utexia brackfieldae]|uniref:CinA family nicotinamide mononucleotide deamidase-related protein n=1 Tax=Utexia brackfieldae TaxID=3074108 RepID=UPI00370D07C7
MAQLNKINIEMLSTGVEVLYGQIIDTNAAWLSDFLFQQGFAMTARTTAGDNLQQLIAMLQARSQENDILIVNGGLGPTQDDLSALAAAIACGETLVLNEPWLRQMQRYYAASGREMSPANEKQAMLPKGAEMISNPVGTACGFSLQMNGCWLFFTPGVPSEFKVMIKDEILPRIRQLYPETEPMLCYRLTILGRSESELASELERNLVLPEAVSLGYRAAMPIVELKLTGPAHCQPAMDNIWQQIQQQVNDSTIFHGTIGLPALIATLLGQKNLHLTVIEQYTAGLLSYQLYQADAPLVKSTVCQGQVHDLRQLAAQQQAETQADIVLAIGDYQPDEHFFEIVLLSQSQSQWQTARFRMTYTSRQYAKPILQETFLTVALDLLRRHLLGLPMVAPNIWLTVEPI